MSDRMAAEIWIGGKVPVELVPDLCATIGGEYVALEWGDARFQPHTAEDLLQACREDHRGVGLLWLCHDEARWGEFEDLEGFLREHGIAFTRHTAARYEYDAETVEHRRQSGLVALATNGSREPVVPASKLTPVEKSLAKGIDQLGRGKTTGGLRNLKRAMRLLREELPPAVPPLEPFEIVGQA